jgi:hypothetical protein
MKTFGGQRLLDPKHITRLVQIATAVEPIPTKQGLTTRHKDIVETLKLEYFIVAGINSGAVVEELIDKKFTTTPYELLAKASIKGHLSRGWVRVSAPMFELLWPILLSIRDYKGSNIEEILSKVVNSMLDTSPEDAIWLQVTRNFNFSTWEGHFKHNKLINFELDSVYAVYKDLAGSGDEHAMVSAREFVEGFPTLLNYFNAVDRTLAYSQAMEKLYLEVNKDKPLGMIADLMACLVFLLMYLEDYKIK